ncbi:MAG: hypothetical protein HY698_17665 [Deltaproteobacteria bacterium]|nr:hypothetical protein [Deltaproteobacteria bacterium]
MIDGRARGSYEPLVLNAVVLALCILALPCCEGSHVGGSPSQSQGDMDPGTDVARAARDRKELLRIVTKPFDATSAKLVTLRFRGTHKIRVTEGGKEVESLDEETSIDLARSADFHAIYQNSRGYGREVFYAAEPGTVWVRPRYGKFHRRPKSSDAEPGKLLSEIHDTLGADLELVEHAASLRDLGRVGHAGRNGRKIALSLASKPDLSQAPEEWRRTLVVKSLVGEVVLDEISGAILAGELASTVSFTRDGRHFEMSLASTHKITDLGSEVSVAFPAEAGSISTPLRSREFEDRQKLLEGIAPPAPKGPLPKEAR